MGGHGGSGKERKEGDGMEGTRDELQVEEYVGATSVCVSSQSSE